MIYDLARGVLLWASVCIFAAGVLWRTAQMISLTRRKDRPPERPAAAQRQLSPEEKKYRLVVAFQNSILGRHPFMTVLSSVFHVCLFAAPLLVGAHVLLLYESLGIALPSLPDALCDALTVVLLACVAIFLVRRLTIAKVKAVSTSGDYLLLFITAAPFLTGFMAYHQWLDYRTIITAHMLTGEIMLAAVPLTKLGHMVFFFFTRLLLGGEYGFAPGTRSWNVRT
jgi:nitrate reductase gamma subunit